MSLAVSNASRSRWFALIILCAGMLMIVLDGTIVNVALPAIQDDLGFSQSSLAWVVNAYLIAFGGLLLLAGRLGDLIGRKRVFLIGLVIFTSASLLCGISASQEMLIGARFVQGVGGALTSGVILGMIVTMFPDEGEQAKAMGIYSSVVAVGASIGLLAGGVLTEIISWHWIFFVNLPFGVAAVFLAMRLIEWDEGIGFAEGADISGAVLITAALMLGVYTIVEVVDYGWGSLHTIGLGALALGLLFGFVTRQVTALQPLLPFRLFRSRNVIGANLVQMLMWAAMFDMFFLSSLFMERVLDYGALQIGLAFLPFALTGGAVSLFLSARLITRFGARRAVLLSLASIAAGLLLMGRVPVEAGYLPNLLPSMLLIGAGSGLTFPAVIKLAMSGATRDDSGLASGVVNTTQRMGAAFGLAVMTTLATSRTDNLLAGGESSAIALTSGYRFAWLVGAGLIASAFVVAFGVLRNAATVQDDAVINLEEAGLEADRAKAA